jgi:hypothetical protein
MGGISPSHKDYLKLNYACAQAASISAFDNATIAA